MKQNVVDQLRKGIEASGESQLSLAEATGINQGNLSRFMRGERGLSMENFAKLCAHLGLSLSAKKAH
jgi:transcriptional regulator with XRE-family HTH domain